MFSSLMLKAGITLLLVTACLFFVWRIVRILNPKPPRPPKPPVEYQVASVPTGNSIVAHGRRQKRTFTVTLTGIGVPSMLEESRANLERMAGKVIRVAVRRRGGLLKGMEVDCRVCDGTGRLYYEKLGREGDCYRCGGSGKWRMGNPVEAEEVFAARGSVEGVVYGETGLCLQLEQLRAGLAISVGEVPEAWAEAEREAMKAKRGLWGRP